MIKKELNRQDDKFTRYMGTVYEDFGSKQALMAEKLIAIKDDLGLVKEDVNVIKEDVDYIKFDIGLIREDLKTKVSRDELPQNILVRK